METLDNYRQLVAEAKTTGKWTRAAIDALIKTNDKAVERTLIRLYELQTEDEKQAQQTRHSNGKGFSALDADILSSFAAQINKGYTLSPRQLAVCRKAGKSGFARLSKYYGQLVQMIQQERQS